MPENFIEKNLASFLKARNKLLNKLNWQQLSQNQKTLYKVLPIIVIAVAIPLTVGLALNQQYFQQFASPRCDPTIPGLAKNCITTIPTPTLIPSPIVQVSSSPTPTTLLSPTLTPTKSPTPTPSITPILTPTPTPTGGQLSAPSGYTSLVFDDKFAGTTYDTSKWIPQIADQNGIWRDNGILPVPYSAVGNQGYYNAEYGNPDQVSINNGLTLNAQRDTTFSGYTWKAGYLTTHSKYTFNHGFVQIRAQMPNSNTGAWAGIWFLEGGGEIDLNESGYVGCGSGVVNQCIASDLHTSGNTQHMYNTGVDLSAGYHTYGMEYKPGQSVAIYFDGVQIAKYTSNVPTGSYTIILTETMAQSATGWHTLTNSSTPSPLSPYKVSEVQVWQ